MSAKKKILFSFLAILFFSVSGVYAWTPVRFSAWPGAAWPSSEKVYGFGLGLADASKGKGEASLTGIQFMALSAETRILKGLQAGGIFSSASEKALGAQISVLGSWTPALRGLQLGGLVAIAGEFRGVQSGLLAYSKKSSGVQFGIISETAGNLYGVQAGLAVSADTGFSGIQAGAFNMSSYFYDSKKDSQEKFKGRGVQLGLVNYAKKDFTGLQLGAVNICRGALRGIQLGILNFGGENAVLPFSAGLNLGF